MSDEWIWVALIVAVPIILFLAIELSSVLRSRRHRVTAMRRKGPEPR